MNETFIITLVKSIQNCKAKLIICLTKASAQLKKRTQSRAEQGAVFERQESNNGAQVPHSLRTGLLKSAAALHRLLAIQPATCT